MGRIKRYLVEAITGKMLDNEYMELKGHVKKERGQIQHGLGEFKEENKRSYLRL